MVCKTDKKLRNRTPAFRRGFTIAAAVLLLAGCASSPKPEQFYAGRSSFALMEPGADLYLSADVAGARPILDRLSLGNMGGKEISAFLDMSSSVTAALYSGASRRFLLAAKGRYPSARSGFFFSASRDWVKVKSAAEIPYWRSGRSGLSVYLNASSAYVSDGDPFAAAPGAESPEALESLAKDAVLSGWMNMPGEFLGRIIQSLGFPARIPADRLVFGVYQAEAGEDVYRAALRLELPNKSQADALLNLFSMARLAAAFIDFSSLEGGGELASLAAVFLANAPETDGSALVLKTGTMQGKDLALLFNTMSLYSN